MSKKKKVDLSNPIFEFIGKYRIFAKYDTNTNDFIRNDDGEIDDSFDDYYMKSGKTEEIHHAYDDVYVLYSWSTERGINIINKIKKINKKIIIYSEMTDGEAIIYFDKKYMDIVNDVIHIYSKGADIFPTDIDNLPKNSYGIPKMEIDKFSDICKSKGLTTGKLKAVYNDFIKSKTTKSNKLFDSYKNSNIPPKEFIYKNDLWEKFIKFIEDYKV